MAVYRLVRWNKGVDINELNADLEEIDPSEFDVETLDMIIPMDASALEGREDDGVTTILCLGNNPFTDERGDNGLCSLIEKKTDSVVYNCAFPDSSAACKYPTYNPEYTRDHFNLYYVTECFRNNEFTAITSIAGDEPDPGYMESVEVMKTVDMDQVDVILIMYDSTDYNMGTPPTIRTTPTMSLPSQEVCGLRFKISKPPGPTSASLYCPTLTPVIWMRTAGFKTAPSLTLETVP